MGYSLCMLCGIEDLKINGVNTLFYIKRGKLLITSNADASYKLEFEDYYFYMLSYDIYYFNLVNGLFFMLIIS